MKHPVYLFALLSLSISFVDCQPAYAQSPIYEQFDVDSVAVPRGGTSMLETFLAVNLRKPFMARVANATGRVFVKAVVEPTGYVSDVKLVRSFRPDCDQEALRVMRLFNAWKPASKGGQAVRQVVTYPIIFRANEPVVYQNGQQLLYLDSQFNIINNSLEAKYIQAVSIDTLTGMPSGDLVVYESNEGKKTSEVSRFPLIRLEIKPHKQTDPPTYRLGHKRKTSDWIGLIYTVKADGSLLSISPTDRLTGHTITYNQDGLTERIEDNELGKITQWFPTGLLMSIEERMPRDTNAHSMPPGYKLVSAWDSTGKAVVTNGNGYQVNYSRMKSRRDSSRTVLFTEEGAYVDGRKQGSWKGQFADGSYLYEERYEKGECLGGKAIANGKTLAYKEAHQNPTFNGGVGALYEFLGATVRYPSEAQRGNITGKVYVSFIVCTDGSLCDYEILKGVHPSVDQEALRVVKKMSSRWLPGIYRGEAVRVKYSLPISFQLE